MTFDKLNAIMIIIGFLLPWVLGFAFVRPFLKQRYGCVFLSFGIGYFIGIFVITLILRLYDIIDVQFSIDKIVLIGFLLSIFLLLFSYSPYSTQPFRLKKTAPNYFFFLSIIILLLIFYRFFLIGVDLTSKPVFPWDGWLSWSAKAKIFFFYGGIPELSSDYVPFWLFDNDSTVSSNGARHPYFISLIQTYTALVYGEWDDNIVNMAWLGLNFAIVLTVWGGLRYLELNVFISVLASYLVISLPVWDTHVSLGSYSDIWVGATILATALLYSIMWQHKEWKLSFLIIFLFVIVYFTKNTALVFLFPFFLIIVLQLTGKKIGFFILIFIGLVFYILLSFFYEDFQYLIQKIMSSKLDMIGFNLVGWEMLFEWIILNNWNFAFIFVLLSTVFAFFISNKNMSVGLSLLIVIGMTFFGCMLGITLLTTKMSGMHFVGYFNRISLYFMPIFSLVSLFIFAKANADEGFLSNSTK